ncbi:MAG TPA: SDR family oxidoreductase [Rhodothermales bacterium]
MSVLVTGATGMIGSVLTRKLVESGADVRILHRRTSPLQMLGDVLPLVDRVEGDVTEPATLAAAMEGVDEVYHVAALIGYGSRRDWPRLRRINVEGTANVVNAALKAGVRRLVYTSSIAAIGRPDGDRIRIDETVEWHVARSNTYYARSKHLAELEVQRGIAEGLDAVLVNPSIVFGVGRAGENTRLLLDQVRRGRMPAAPAGGTNFVDAEDAADGHIRAMERGRTGERYILGGENLLWREAFAIIAEEFGAAPPRFIIPPPLAMTVGVTMEALSLVLPLSRVVSRETARTSSRVYLYDNTRAREELGCTFRSFQETIQRIAEAMRASGDAR